MTDDANRAAGRGLPRPGMLRIPRRTFLRLTGLTAAGLAGAHAAHAARHGPAAVGSASAQVEALDALDAAAAALDYDPDKIFRFVADEIRYEPYAGVLRGAAGTLASGAGNAADQAVLLSALLRAALVESRFVVGSLDDATAEAVLGGASVDTATTRDRVAAAIRGTLPGTTPPEEPTGTLPPELDSLVARAPELATVAADWVNARLDDGVATILGALDDAGLTIASSAPTLPAAERERHVWLHVTQGADWVDLDPTIAGTAPGTAIATLDGDPLDALPDDMRHRIDVVISVEAVEAGAPAERSIMEQSLFADEVAGQPLVLIHEQPDGLKGVGISIELAVGGSGPQYQPILLVGKDAYVGNRGIMVGGGQGGVFDSGEAGTGPAEGEALAEFLEIRVTAPDGTSSVARRTLFDRVGQAARAAGTIDLASIPPVEMVAVGADGKPEFPPMTASRFLSVASGISTLASIRTQAEDDDEVMPIGAGALLYHLARDAAAGTFALDRGVRPYLDGVNVAMLTVTPQPQPDGGWVLGTGYDMVHRSQATLPLTDGGEVRAPGIVAGVLSHVIERIHGGDGPDALREEGDPLPVSAGSIVEAAAATGIGLVVLRDALPGDLPYPPEVSARIAEALSAGWLAIAPAGPVPVGGRERLGWWLVDPVSGRAIDQLDDGTGATFAEYGQKLLNLLRTVKPWFCLGWTLYEAYHLVHSIFHGDLFGFLVEGAITSLAHKKACH